MHCTIALVLCLVPASPGDPTQTGIQAFKAGDYKLAVEHLTKAIAQDPKNFDALAYRASASDRQRQFAEAAPDFTKCIDLRPKEARSDNARGAVHFKLGKLKESLADFDKFLALEPAQKNEHWMRGITLYYLEMFDEGRKQFEGYENVDTNDVENAVWHFMCVARKDGVEKARAGLLKIGKDKRVPMMEVYDLFAGKLKPDDVLKAAKTPDTSAKLLSQQMFYAHLYLGVYYEVHGDTKKALEHLEQAVQQRQENHYMWEVARVHRDLRKR